MRQLAVLALILALALGFSTVEARDTIVGRVQPLPVSR